MLKEAIEGQRTVIIAEAGVNHNGDVAIAKKLIDAAVEAGVDAVKFQTFKAEKVVSAYAPKAKYQKNTTAKDESQLEMIKKLELDTEAHRVLIDYCTEKNIRFLSTPFDLESIDLLNKLGLEVLKIPSGEITNLPYLRKIGSLKKKIIMSTGMAKLGEIENALETLTSSGTQLRNITVLHCNSEYPTFFEDVNLRAMLTIRAAFPNIRVGYSAHTLGIEVPIAAVALGASVIEKHFTLDRNMSGPDHKASLEPTELKEMVEAIRNIEKAMGSGIKKPSRSELNNMTVIRKSIVAEMDTYKGEVFSEYNITTKRPAGGISPIHWDNLIGMTAKKSFKKDEFIEL